MNVELLQRLYALSFVRITGLTLPGYNPPEVFPNVDHPIWMKNVNYVVFVGGGEIYLADVNIVWHQDSIRHMLRCILAEVYGHYDFIFDDENYCAESFLPTEPGLADHPHLTYRFVDPNWNVGDYIETDEEQALPPSGVYRL